MTIDLLKNITITDSDINWVETIMGNTIHFDQDRRNIIKSLDSIDIQAFPGSGKTTVLVAKLAILAKKWPFSNKGICVLSHTNVAREEIEKRLGKSNIGKKLLSYPHFIGTVHSFADTYITKPWLNSCGINIELIDSEIVLEKRWNSLRYGTRSHLEKMLRNKTICQYHEKIGQINWDTQGKVYENICDVIKNSTQNGYLTFNEVLLHACTALKKIPFLSNSLQSRFPILFIDEAQDTDSMQWTIINSAFPENSNLCIRQGFGDSNQAIFSKTSDSANENLFFPRPSYLLLKESRRFDNRIATFSNTMALSTDIMTGSSNEFSDHALQHTLFLFSRDSEHSKKVIDAYAELLLNSFSDSELQKYCKEGCYVIGAVHNKNEETEDKYFPKGIYDYWNEYDASKVKNTPPRLLIEYFRKGAYSFNLSSNTDEQVEWMAKGICQLLKNANSEGVVKSSGRSLNSLCKALSRDDSSKLRHILLDFLNMDLSMESDWNRIQTHLGEILELFGKYINNRSLQEFVQWSEEIIDNSVDETDESHKVIPNVYVYTNSEGRSINLHFDSIHNVKGRTHLSTLVVETYYKTHNMKKLVRYLCNSTNAKKNIADYGRFKCQYVAMTRARALLCMAIPAEFVTDKQRKKFLELGWQVIDIL